MASSDTQFKKGQIAWNKTNMFLDCPTCGNKFKIKPSHAYRRKFCSKKCKRLTPEHIEIVRKFQTRNSVYKNCIVCNKLFRLPPSQSNRKCCSRICSDKSRYGLTPWNKNMKPYKYSGSKSSNWRGGITPIDKQQRKLFINTMRKQVFERDDYTCQLCGARNGEGKRVDLQVDHIQSWSEYVELRFNMDNCRTLCMDCHYKITFGRSKPKNVKNWGNNFIKGVIHG